MIDWITATLKVDHTYPALGGYRTNLDEKRNLQSEFTTFAKLSGTFDKRMMVKSQYEVMNSETGERTYTELYFSGNPVKVLQGHNIFGTDDLEGLVFAMIEKAVHFFGLDIDVKQISRDDINLIKVDINYSFLLKNERHVEMWINSAERTASLPYAGRGVLKSTTSLVFAEKSKYWRFKIYGKYQELMARKKDSKHLDNSMIDFTKNILRVELEAKKLLKKTGLNKLENWNLQTPRKLFNEYLSKMNISENLLVPDEKLYQLTPTQQNVYRLWLEGHDMKTYYKPRTFRNWRNKMIELLNVDIALTNKNESAQCSNVVPLIQYIEAEPMSFEDIPPEFKQGVLLFQPKEYQRFVA